MTNQSTLDKLIEMHMTPMADAFRIQKDDPAMKEVPFEDRFGMLVDTEYTARKNNRLKRLIRNAEFEQPDASIAAIDYGHNRKLNRTLIDFKSAKDEGRFPDVLKKYTTPALLILDEWLLLKLSDDDAPNLLELIHKRRRHSSTIFCCCATF